MITPRRSLSPHHAASWRHHPRDYDLSWHCLHGTMWRATITSFHYWKGLSPGHACPVFAYYFTKKAEVLMRPHENSFEQIVKYIKKYRIDWVLLSPEPSLLESDLLPGFINNYKLRPEMLEKAVIFNTGTVYREL